ncbi:MAG: NAD(P)-dependent oxidoreductase [Bacteroidota bacterium]
MANTNTSNVLLLETVATAADALLRSQSNVIFAAAPDAGEAHIEGRPIHAIVTRGKGKVNAALIDACKGLQLIARCGVGLDNIDVAYASSKGIKVVNAPGSNSATVAEHALSLMLMLQRHMTKATAAVKAGNWQYRTVYAGDDLRGKKLGIAGFGNIGQRVARLADAFGMDIQFWDVAEIDTPYTQVPFDTLIATSQVITIHLPLLDSTRDLFSRDVLRRAKQQPVLINTARGGLVKDADLLLALEEGWISGFGGDVLEIGTPPPEYPLLKLDNVLVTPHSASLTKTTYAEMCMITVQNALRLLAGEAIEERYLFNRNSL